MVYEKIMGYFPLWMGSFGWESKQLYESYFIKADSKSKNYIIQCQIKINMVNSLGIVWKIIDKTKYINDF